MASRSSGKPSSETPSSGSPSNVLSLAERLKAKIEADRSEIEALTSAELRKLAESLQQQSSDAVNSTASGIGSELQSVQQRLSEQTMALKTILRGLEAEFRSIGTLTLRSWLKPLLIGLSVCVGIFVGSLGMMRYLSGSIESQMKEREALSLELMELRQVRSQAESWGVEFMQDPEKGGRFVVLPKGTRVEVPSRKGGAPKLVKTWWECGGKPCIKLGRR